MAFASVWLCLAGAVAVAENGNDAIAVPGLISLAVFLLVTYFVWLSVNTFSEPQPPMDVDSVHFRSHCGITFKYGVIGEW